MSELIVIGFETSDAARAALKDLRSIEHVGKIHFEDTAVVERDPGGQVHVKNEASGTTETAAIIGGAIGGIVTFAFPPAGIAIGAAVGAGIGALMHTGVDGDFVDDIKNKLEPGKSALFIVIKDADADALDAALRPYRGSIIQTTVDEDVEAGLRDALQ